MRFDAIVVGLGIMGCSALYHLARRGARVVGIDPFSPPHDQGSSHGENRIIRKAYFEHPDYIPMLNRSFELWGELEAETGERLQNTCGLLVVGPRDGAVVPAILENASLHGQMMQPIPVSEIGSLRFPGFVADPDASALFDPEGGFLRVEACVSAYLDAACRHGAATMTGRRITSWSSDDRLAQVVTEGEAVEADRVVICGGGWSAEILGNIGVPLRVLRKVQLWVPAHSHYAVQSGCPVYAYEFNSTFGTAQGEAVGSSTFAPLASGGFFYGFPSIEGGVMKAAEHTGEEVARSASQLDRTLHPSDSRRVLAFLERYLPLAGRNIVRHSVCMYTMTPDRHFVIDMHPRHRNVCYATGFSGHGFKFAPLVGKVLADLALDGGTREAVAFLRAGRFAAAG